MINKQGMVLRYYCFFSPYHTIFFLYACKTIFVHVNDQTSFFGSERMNPLLSETKIKSSKQYKRLVSFSRLFVLPLSYQIMQRVQWAHKMFQLSLPDQPWTFETQLFSIIQTLCEEQIFTAHFNHLDKSPHTLQQKLQNMRLSSIHTTTFFTTATNFSAVLYIG